MVNRQFCVWRGDHGFRLPMFKMEQKIAYPLIQNDLVRWMSVLYEENLSEELPGVRRLEDASISTKRNSGENNSRPDFCEAVSLREM